MLPQWWSETWIEQLVAQAARLCWFSEEVTGEPSVLRAKRKIPEAAGPRGAKDSGYFREAIANCVFVCLQRVEFDSVR